MRGRGIYAPGTGPCLSGFNAFALIFLFLLAACGDGLQRQRGLAPTAVLTVSGGPVYDFGTIPVDTAVDRPFTVTNIGAQKATEVTGDFYFSMSFSFAGGTYPGEGGTCTADLPPAGSCTIIVRFYPRFSGDSTSLLPMSYFDGGVTRAYDGLSFKGRAISAP